jgi:hypothetical protein
VLKYDVYKIIFIGDRWILEKKLVFFQQAETKFWPWLIAYPRVCLQAPRNLLHHAASLFYTMTLNPLEAE